MTVRPDDGLQTAAVLVPLFRDAADELRTVLVVRGSMGIHGGQLGFPGGKPEPGDESLLDTALREAEEEIGLARQLVEILDELPPLDTSVTGYRVHAFLGRIPAGVAWRLREHEIAGLLTPSVHSLAHAADRGTYPYSSPAIPETMMVEGIPIDEHLLWGMTLRLLDPLLPRLMAGEWSL